MNEHEKHWAHFLDPEVVRPSLFMATMFITTFEILKNSIVDRIRNFYSIGWSAGRQMATPFLQNTPVKFFHVTRVLSTHR